MPFLPLVVTALSASDLERVAADPRVKSISRDNLNRPTLAQSVPLIGGDYAATLGATGAGYTVGILDTGFQYSHPFLAGRIIRATCHSHNSSGYTTLCPNGQTSQSGGNAAINCTGSVDCAHGTHVAGIAAGYRASGTPSRGVAPSANIFAIQVFSRYSNGSLAAFDSDVIAGLQDLYANRSALKIAAANLSLAGAVSTATCDSVAIASTIKLLRDAGIATVIASGNNGSTQGVTAPGCVTNAITVGSSTKGDKISSFSNMSSMVDLMAPGESITSSVPTSTFAAFRGTSMAAPHVTGAFAALKSAVPTATVSAIETALKATGVPIVDNRSGGTVTKPRINIYLALLRLRGQTLPPSNDRFLSAINVSPAAKSATTVSASNVNATLETGEPRGNSYVQATLWWKFTATRTESVRLATTGSAIDTTLGVYTGTSVSALTQLAFNDDVSTTSKISQTAFRTVSGTTYYVQVGSHGSARGAVKLVFDHPPPSNDTASGAIAFSVPNTGSVKVTGDNSFATTESGAPRFSAEVTNTLWWKVTPTTTRNYWVQTTGSNFDTTLAIYRGSPTTSFTLVASNDNFGAATTSQIKVPLAANTTYYVQVGGHDGARGTVQLTAQIVGPTNDMIAGARALAAQPGTVTGTNVDASVQSGEILPSSSVQATAWWRFTATASKTVTITTSGSSFDTTLAVMSAASPTSTPSLVGYNDNYPGKVTSRLSFSTVAGRTYFIQIGGKGTARGTISFYFPEGLPLYATQSTASLN